MPTSQSKCKIDKLPKNINNIVKIIEDIDQLKKCKNGLDWNKVVPNEKIRTVLFFAYINTYPIALYDYSFMERHKFLLTDNYDDEYFQCKGCWDCCGSLIDINYRKFYTNNFADNNNDMHTNEMIGNINDKNKSDSENDSDKKKILNVITQKKFIENQKEFYGEERNRAILALQRKIARKKDDDNLDNLRKQLRDLKDINIPFKLKEKKTIEEKREQTRMRQKKFQDNKKNK